MAKELIRHHDERRKENEAKTSELGRHTQKQYKCEKRDDPEAIVRVGLEFINYPGSFLE
jgi:hypothetical protein